jgi:hypothetical protein
MPKRKGESQKRQKMVDMHFAKTPKNERKAGAMPPIVHDPFSQKKPRGRPPRIPASTVIGRADNCRYQLKQVWNQLEEPLLAAQSEDEVKAALESRASAYASSYVPHQVVDLLALIHDKQFPKDSEARVNFLADSLGGRPNLAFRSSRDVCARERAKQRAKSPYQILRHEYYVECSCGYEGPARDGACRKCGAEISRFQNMVWGN